MPPSLLTAPVLLAAETVAVVAIELKLVGELHEVCGVPPPAGGVQRAVGAAVASYLNRRATRAMADLLRADLRRRAGAPPDPP